MKPGSPTQPNVSQTQLRRSRFLLLLLVCLAVAVGILWLLFAWQSDFVDSGNQEETQVASQEPDSQSQTTPVSSPEPTSVPISSPDLTTAPTPDPEPVIAPIPAQHLLSSSTHVFQTFNNCGPAALSMALSYFDIRVTQQELGQALRPHQNPQGNNDDKSVTLSELELKAREYGLTPYHRPVGDIELLEQFVAHEMPVITRTWLSPGEDIGHYRVVVGYDQQAGVLIQDDSLQGNDLRYGYQEFLDIWKAFNYEFLVLVPEDKQQVAARILGERLDEQEAWELALTLAEQQIQDDPANVDARFNQAIASYYLGDFQQTITSYESIADELPSRTLWYQIEPILAYYRVGDHDRVLALSQSVFDSQNRAFSELHALRANIFAARGQHSLAMQSGQLATQFNSTMDWRHVLQEKLTQGAAHEE